MITLRAAALAALVAALVTAAVALTGCAADRDADWRPPAWPDAGVAFAEGQAPLDAASIGLISRRVRGDVVGLQARWALLPGDAALNTALESRVREVIGTREHESGARYAPQVFPQGTGLGDRSCVPGSTLRDAGEVLADPALGPAGGSGAAIVCDVVWARGEFIGERLRIVEGSPAAITRDESTVLYAQPGAPSAPVFDAGSIWNDDAATLIWEHLVDARRRAAGALTLAPVSAPDAEGHTLVTNALTTAVPTSEGGMALRLAPGFTAPELTALGIEATGEPTSIVLDASFATTLLSDTGARLLASAAAPETHATPMPGGAASVDCTLVPCVALSYDDGPSDLTPGILDDVARHHASVTFFVMGEKSEHYAATLRRALAEGNLVENHSWNHPHLPDIPLASAMRQLSDTSAAIEAATGVRPTVYRPPYGDLNRAVREAAGMAAILWDVDTFDWQGPADDVLLERIVDQPTPGSIVLQHDIHGNTARTADAAYTGLEDRGFVLVNVQQLFGGSLPGSGAWRRGP